MKTYFYKNKYEVEMIIFATIFVFIFVYIIVTASLMAIDTNSASRCCEIQNYVSIAKNSGEIFTLGDWTTVCVDGNGNLKTFKGLP